MSFLKSLGVLGVPLDQGSERTDIFGGDKSVKAQPITLTRHLTTKRSTWLDVLLFSLTVVIPKQLDIYDVDTYKSIASMVDSGVQVTPLVMTKFSMYWTQIPLMACIPDHAECKSSQRV